MADYGGTLKKFRASGYPKEAEKEPSSSGVRTIQLTDDESRELQPYQEKFGPGEEMVVEVTGKLEGSTLRVTSVKYAQGGEGPEGMDANADAQELMAKFK